MSKLKQKRLLLVERTMRAGGIEHNGECLMSLWDMACNLNNCWNAKHFVNTKRFQSSHDRGFVLNDWQIGEMFNAIRGCVDSPLVLLVSPGNQSEYIAWENYKASAEVE